METETRICQFCGKKFKTRKPNQIFCSKECCYNNQHNIITIKICPVCGTTFETRFNTQKYCSDSCRVTSYRKSTNLTEPSEEAKKAREEVVKKVKATKSTRNQAAKAISEKKKLTAEFAHRLRMKHQEEARKLGISYGQYIAQIKHKEI